MARLSPMIDPHVRPLLSVIVPFHDEEGNVPGLAAELFAALDALGRPWEAFLVDDGSADGTFAELRRAQEGRSGVTVLRLRRRGGQTAAIQAGLDRAHGALVATLDGDRQNDPADLPRLLDALDAGADFAVGRRRRRRDPFWTRVLPSRAANALLRLALGIPLHDVGCGLRCFRRETLEGVRLHGQMHRFLPILAHWRGARLAEVEVSHRARAWGSAKYGLSRAARIALDLAAARLVAVPFARPFRLFGALGSAALALSAASGGAVLWMKLRHAADMTGNPLFYLSIVSLLIGGQLLALGLLGELNVRACRETLGDPLSPLVETFPPRPARAASAP